LKLQHSITVQIQRRNWRLRATSLQTSVLSSEKLAGTKFNV